MKRRPAAHKSLEPRGEREPQILRSAATRLAGPAERRTKWSQYPAEGKPASEEKLATAAVDTNLVRLADDLMNSSPKWNFYL